MLSMHELANVGMLFVDRKARKMPSAFRLIMDCCKAAETFKEQWMRPEALKTKMILMPICDG